MLASSAADLCVLAAKVALIPINPKLHCIEILEILNFRLVNLPSAVMHVFAAQQMLGMN
jgi:hypothetical protein